MVLTGNSKARTATTKVAITRMALLPEQVGQCTTWLQIGAGWARDSRRLGEVPRNGISPHRPLQSARLLLRQGHPPAGDNPLCNRRRGDLLSLKLVYCARVLGRRSVRTGDYARVSIDGWLQECSTKAAQPSKK